RRKRGRAVAPERAEGDRRWCHRGGLERAGPGVDPGRGQRRGPSRRPGAAPPPVPPRDGTVEMSPAALAAFSGDFGRLVTGTPMAVLRPGSVKDIVKMVRYARSNGLTIAMNGQSGTDDEVESHSNFGQARAPGGIAIDARSLRIIHRVDNRCADVDAGVTWSELDAAAAAV